MIGNFFIKRPKFAIVISLVIILGGLIALFRLPLEEYPSITPPQILVTAKYSGASSDVIASTVAAPIELQLNGIEGMLYMSSESTNGVYKLTIYFNVGADPDMALVNVQNQLQLVQPRLPEEVKRYGLSVKKSTGGAGCLMMTLTSPNGTYDSLFLANYATMYLKDEIARIKGCGNVQIFGAGEYSMRIWLKPEKMASLGVSVNDVKDSIIQQNSQTSAGDIGVEPMKNPQLMKFTLRTTGRLKDVQEFENIIVKSRINGSNVKIKDIAWVELGAENYSSSVKAGAKDAVMISISQLPEANTINLVNNIQSKMLELSKKFPNDIEYFTQYDATEFVRESIREVLFSILLAIILVGIVTYVFLGDFRSAFIPFCAIPVSLIGVFIFMSIFGFSINLLILFALVLAVGLVVDDAIVVLENTQRHISLGKNPKEATEISMNEVFGAVVATSLVLMAVFVPVSFMSGITGQMYRQFAICIATSIGLSTIVAITLSPALCSIILKKSSNNSHKNIVVNTFERWFCWLKSKYLKTAEYFIKSMKLTIFSLFILILFIVILFKITPTGFLPDEDRGALFVQIQLPDGATLFRSSNLSSKISEEILKIKGVASVMQINGFSGENTSFIVAKLSPWSQRKSSKFSVANITKEINKVTNKYPEALSFVAQPPAISGLGMFGGFEYELLDKGGRTSEELFNMSQKLLSEARLNPVFFNIYTSYTSSLPQVVIDVDEEKTLVQGVSIKDVNDTLATLFGATYVNDFNKFGRVYRVYMQADSVNRENISDINKVYVKNKDGKMLQLSSVINTKEVVGPYLLSRFNMYPCITINGNPSKGVSSGKAMKTLENLSDKILPEDMSFAWSGTALQEQKSSGQIFSILCMALIFVYLFLVALYESWVLPIAVLLISPVAIMGALFLQFVSGLSLDIYAQVGLVMLVGLSTKQAILIIEFAKDAMQSKKISFQEAALQAANLRFRAVMMTNIAFILGLLPLVFAHGAGAGSRNSIGVSVLGGMIGVAFIGTILVPAFFVLVNLFFDRLGIYFNKNRRKNV